MAGLQKNEGNFYHSGAAGFILARRRGRMLNHPARLGGQFGQRISMSRLGDPTPTLYQWAEQHIDMARLSHCPPRGAREWLAVWLGQADLRDDRPSKIAAEMYDLLRDSIPDFVLRGDARLYCYFCEAWTSDVNEEELDRGRDGVWHVWTIRWSCPRAHRLYQESHQMHLQYRRN